MPYFEKNENKKKLTLICNEEDEVQITIKFKRPPMYARPIIKILNSDTRIVDKDQEINCKKDKG